MKNKIFVPLIPIFLTLLVFHTASAQNIDIKAYQTRLSEVMETIGKKAKRKVILDTNENPLISIGSKDASLNDTLGKIQNLYGFTFDVSDESITVKSKVAAKKGRGIASIEDGSDLEGAADQTPLELQSSGYHYHSIPVNNADLNFVMTQVKSIVGDSIKFLVTDTKNNSIVLYGDDNKAKLIRQIVDDLDRAPAQILLAAKVIEATSNFARDVGIVLSRDGGRNGIFTATNSGAAPTQGVAKFNFGIIDSIGLDATIQSGETDGDAKIISNPQVVTTDGKAASLTSGLTFSVKVATTVNGVTTASLEKVTAGLKLDVTPKIGRDGRIGMVISVDSSQVDKGSSIDGVPGIAATAVKTEMIIRPGQTAAIGGLYKHSADDSTSGIPLFKDVPIFGALFRSNSASKARQEVMAFITPQIVENNERSISFDPAKADAKDKVPVSRK